MTITLSVIKADVGGYVGHSESHPDVLVKARECLTKAKKEGLIVDYHVTKCGDDLQLEQMEYTTMPEVAKKLKGRFVDLD